jgi:hypothetical protein
VRGLLARRQPPAAQALALYRRTCRLSRSVGLAPRLGETAREHARRVAAHDPLAGPDMLYVAGLYQGIVYGKHHPSAADVAEARAALARLRWCWLRRRLRLQRAGAPSGDRQPGLHVLS